MLEFKSDFLTGVSINLYEINAKKTLMIIAKIKIEIIVDDNIVEKAIESIKNAAYSGRIGDGKIFVSNIEQAIRIRTGEKGSDAV